MIQRRLKCRVFNEKNQSPLSQRGFIFAMNVFKSFQKCYDWMAQFVEVVGSNSTPRSFWTSTIPPLPGVILNSDYTSYTASYINSFYSLINIQHIFIKYCFFHTMLLQVQRLSQYKNKRKFLNISQCRKTSERSHIKLWNKEELTV